MFIEGPLSVESHSFRSDSPSRIWIARQANPHIQLLRSWNLDTKITNGRWQR